MEDLYVAISADTSSRGASAEAEGEYPSLPMKILLSDSKCLVER